MFHYLLSLIFLVQFVVADKNNIFKAIELTSQNDDNKPLSPWTAKVSFDFQNISQYANYERFSLKMPNVYRVKFDGGSQTLSATSGDKTLFTCGQTSGSYYLDYSLLSCNIGDDLIDADFDSVSGDIEFTVFFGVGGSAYSVEIEDANTLNVGSNTITWNDNLTTTIDLASETYTDGIYVFSHTTGHDSVEDYFLLPACSSGSQSGSAELDFGADVSGEGQVNCELTQVYITNDLNDWLFPKSYESADFTINCTSSKISFDYENLPAGYRIFVTTFQYQATTELTLNNKVKYDIQCASAGSSTSDEYYQNIDIATRQATASALPLFVTTSGYEGTTTSLSTTIDSVSPTAGTIYILTPYPKESTTTTTTSTWSNSHTTTTTEPFSSGDLTVTVDVDVPGPKQSTTTTTTSTWTDSYTTTTTEPFSSGDLTVTIDVDVPGPSTTSISRTPGASSSLPDTTTLSPGDSTVYSTIQCLYCTNANSSSSVTTSSSSPSFVSISSSESASSSSSIVPVISLSSKLIVSTTPVVPASPESSSVYSSSVSLIPSSYPTTAYGSTTSSVISSIVFSSKTSISPSVVVESSSTVISSIRKFSGSIDAVQPSSSNDGIPTSSFATILTSIETPSENASSSPSPSTTSAHSISTYATTSDNKAFTVTKTYTDHQNSLSSIQTSTTPALAQQSSTSIESQPSVAMSTNPSVEQYEGVASRAKISSTLLLFLSVFIF